MENDFLYLTYYQVMTFMIRIREMENENPYFHDEIVSAFNNNIISRSEEIARSSSFKLKLIPNANKFKVSQGMVKYLKNLTDVDVFDNDDLKKYIPLIKNLEKNLEKETMDRIKNMRR